MKCTNCGFDNPAGLRFCGQCANELSLVCANCGAENPTRFHYCGQCASPLASNDASAHPTLVPVRAVRDLADRILGPTPQLLGERRNITVLFVDVSSFTPLAEKLDPEVVYAAIDQYLHALVEQVELYGGQVDKFTGDGLMALFGAPLARENHAERALRAGLGMQRTLGQLAEAGALPFALRARIGVNTGQVVVGSLGSGFSLDERVSDDLAGPAVGPPGRAAPSRPTMDTYTAMGDTVNVAARLESQAEPGGVLVSQSVYELTHPIFDFEHIGPLRVKGRQEPVEVYKLRGEKLQPGSLRGARGLVAPLVGRAEEYNRLQSLVGRTRTQQTGSIVLLTGEAGLGKSRLTTELRAGLAHDEFTVLVGETVSYGRATSYQLFVRMFQRFFALDEAADPGAAVERLRQQLESLDTELVETALPYLAILLGLPLAPRVRQRISQLEPEQVRQQTFLAIRSLFAAMAARRPLWLILEDLHWADELSLELILFLLNMVEQAPVVLYGITRPQEGQAVTRVDELARRRFPARYERIDLHPLKPADNASLIQSLLALPDLPRPIEDLITEKAEGNPFFTEELIGVLIDRGVFSRSNGGWQVRPEVDLTLVDVPVTLDGLIMSRVDSMGPVARHILQCAAVIGREFSPRLLRSLLGNDPIELEPQLAAMESRGFIAYRPDGSGAGYEFRHGLVRDSVYNSLLFRRRKQLHGEVAHALTQLYPDRASDEPETLAYHLSLSNNPGEALPYLIAAGHRARQRFANQEAIDYYTRALAQMEAGQEATSEQLVAISVGLGEVRALRGEYEAAIEAYETALAHLESDPGASAVDTADLQRRLGRAHENQGAFAEAMRRLEAGLETLDRAGQPPDSISRGRIFLEQGWVQYRQGNGDLALERTLKALEILEGSTLLGELASAYNRLLALYAAIGEPEQALAYGEKGLALRRELGDSYGLARSYSNLGAQVDVLGNWDRAVEYYERGIELFEKIGFLEGVFGGNLNVGIIHRSRGDLQRAEQHFQKALRAARTLANPTLALALSEMGELKVLQEDFPQALAHLEESRRVSREMGVRNYLGEAQWRTAWAYLKSGDRSSARHWVRQALELATQTGNAENLGDSHRILGMLALEEGLLEEAENHLRESLQTFERLRFRHKMARSQYQLGKLYSRQAGRQEEALQQTTAALETFQALGAQPELEKARAQLQRLKSKA